VYGLATSETEATMQNRLFRLIRNLSFVLASVLLPIGAASADPHTNRGAAFDQTSGITAVGDKSVTPRHTRLPNVSPGTDRVAAGLEWIAAVPEPRAIVFLGATLLFASGIARRRFMRNGKV